MIGKPTLTAVAGAVLALVLLVLPATRGQAGCGCDRPPPEWAMVMPAFGSPGASIQISADGGEFVQGEVYEVAFGDKRTVAVVAQDSNVLEVSVPDRLKLGPVGIEVTGPGYERRYGDELFTALPPALAVPPGSGKYVNAGYEAAIAADGTVLIPVDVGEVLDPTQFAMAFRNLPLAFDHDDVAIYNADRLDLTLFTFEVEDPSERQWGGCYGWVVEQDAGLFGAPCEAEVETPYGYRYLSDIVTYWRHELDQDGRHPDGTLHVDHEHLVFAISGLERNRVLPWDLTRAKGLEPGSRKVSLVWLSLVSDEPVSAWNMGLLLEFDLGLHRGALRVAKDDE